MNNKDWDSYLQDLLGDFEPQGDSHWEALDSHLNGSATGNTPNLSDESLRDSLSDYKPAGEVQGWEKLASSLDKADADFDHEVADKVKHYNAPDDPEAWALFLKNFSTYKALRFKLVALKIAEVGAVLLLLFTIFQMNQKGALPVFEKQSNIAASLNNSDLPVEQATTEFVWPSTPNLSGGHQASTEIHSPHIATNNQSLESNLIGIISDTRSEDGESPSGHLSLLPASSNQKIVYSNTTGADRLSGSNEIISLSPRANLAPNNIENKHIIASIALADVSSELALESEIPFPVCTKPGHKGQLVFGMLAQVDFNTLKMPQDILYTNRKQYVFPLQGLHSTGYGAGFTLGVEHNRLAFESGIIYSTKTFKPGRSLTVGEGSDQGSVEFDAMQIQLISIPLQLRYQFSKDRLFNVYAIAGFGMHIIAQSDIDVDVQYNFNSLPAGENPNNHPALSQTIRESQRLSDNFRHKAPFSTQSFVSANIGLGVEYTIAERKSLFLQTTYQYQIPNLRFSNHNGKHLVSTAIQAGVRTPLGL